MNKRSCLADIIDTDLNSPIKSNFISKEYILPILLLTVVNNRGRKNRVSFQGYDCASGIEFMRMFMELNNYKEYYSKNLGLSMYTRLSHTFLLWFIKSWSQNIKSAKRHLSDQKIISLFSQFTNLTCDKVGSSGIMAQEEIEYNDKIMTDLHRSYFKNSKNKLNDKFKKINQINQSSMDVLLDNRMGKLCELILLLGWTLGCGDETSSGRLVKAGKSFGIMYQIALDFENIERVLDRIVDGNVTNYVLNCGIQDAYEKFMDNKQRFIEEALNLDIYTNTIKEIVDIIEDKVDNIVDNSSSDIKSSYSTLK